MNVVQVVPSVSDESSGYCTAVIGFCKALRACGAEVALHTLDYGPPVKEGETVDIRQHPILPVVSRLGICQYPIQPVVRRLGVSPEMERALAEAAATVDILHNHSLWTMPSVYPAWAARGPKARCRLVTSPHGTLSRWSLRRSRWRKKVMWSLTQGRAVRDSALLHATSESECAEFRSLGLRAPIALIPNGIAIPEVPAGGQDPGERRTLLFLGRIHPKKGVENLVRAWREVESQFPEWDLEFVGPDNDSPGYLSKMENLAGSLGIRRAAFLGPKCGEEKAAVYRKADLFVLPTLNENFGMSVAEALAYGIPVIVTKGAPWSGLEEHAAGWWIDIGVEPLVETLRTALVLPREELSAMGARGRVWMQRDFSWDRMGQMMLETYAWLQGGGTPPPWVRRSA